MEKKGDRAENLLENGGMLSQCRQEASNAKDISSSHDELIQTPSPASNECFSSLIPIKSVDHNSSISRVLESILFHVSENSHVNAMALQVDNEANASDLEGHSFSPSIKERDQKVIANASNISESTVLSDKGTDHNVEESLTGDANGVQRSSQATICRNLETLKMGRVAKKVPNLVAKDKDGYVEEANKILEIALAMGLSIQGGVEEGAKLLAKSLEEESPPVVKLGLGTLQLNTLLDQDALWLDRPISLEELDFALKMSSNDKSPGPDGMSFGFVKYLWGNLKSLLLETIDIFSKSEKFPKGFNSYFIALVPKVDQPK
ncbi:hypothetical protein POM88_003981 [Heracleum sosnowskyi]|uniref:Uncharacterized protein n=1 Tax=Heracleum sosnowskyi TaxID=360622 RepID=A0AAD8JIL9_9APIA|nr:hypothetical protein POM88_003981 [Heracleum sosnowskyi]